MSCTPRLTLDFPKGSSVQLPSYNYAKSKLVSNGIMSDSSYWTYLVSSSFSGICVVSASRIVMSSLNSAQQLADLIVLDDAVSLPLLQQLFR